MELVIIQAASNVVNLEASQKKYFMELARRVHEHDSLVEPWVIDECDEKQIVTYERTEVLGEYTHRLAREALSFIQIHMVVSGMEFEWETWPPTVQMNTKVDSAQIDMLSIRDVIRLFTHLYNSDKSTGGYLFRDSFESGSTPRLLRRVATILETNEQQV